LTVSFSQIFITPPFTIPSSQWQVALEVGLSARAVQDPQVGQLRRRRRERRQPVGGVAERHMHDAIYRLRAKQDETGK
jgi:hypothetical protein